MPVHSERKFLPYTADELFDLVADVEAYPDFLPWCAGTRIKSRTAGESDAGHPCTFMTADLAVRFKVFRETFTSRVMLDKAHHRILIEYLDGPFKYLENRWIFEPSDGGAVIDFHIDFEFRSRPLQVLIGTMFEHAVERMMRAFEERAREVYGAR